MSHAFSPTVVRALVVLGTRPEAIKLAPILLAARSGNGAAVGGGRLETIVCSTGQHREMLAPALEYFNIRVDVDLNLMSAGQSLAGLAARCLAGIDATIDSVAPDVVLAQGDTTTAFAAAQAAFFRRVPFAHVEAGLRTGDLSAPWPEEFHRRVATLAASLHFAPTERAATALCQEGIAESRIHVTGNTIVDALLWTVDRERGSALWRDKYSDLEGRPVVLVTGHRRENQGAGLEELCAAISELAERFPEARFIYPVHLNPRVDAPVRRALALRSNVLLPPPLDYPEFVWLMDRASLILTDSGGIQEEAPSLRKPVLVFRETTERPEAVEAGLAQLVGPHREAIVAAVERILQAAEPVLAMPERPAGNFAAGFNPFGDGRAAERIVRLLLARAWESRRQ